MTLSPHAAETTSVIGPLPLPRNLAPGVHWLGGCLQQPYQGKMFHSYNSVYVVSGTKKSVVVETGFPGDIDLIESQLDQLISSVAPIEYVFSTHPETPHAGGVGRLLDKYPSAVAIGGVQDLHLAFPQFADRIEVPTGETLHYDLGGRTFRIVGGVIRDLMPTYWGFDDKSRALFPGDGFAYSHYHTDGHCGLVAEEATSLDLPDMTALFAELALYWTRLTDVEPYLQELDLLLEGLDVQLICPTHGLPIVDLPHTVPAVREGFRLGARS
ncbi:MBL fold metallo-hydrolase [Mycobacterium sp. 21AC1]|uniref:MBL fold metallo-hydrolase n=1 Tax=[Mycobacterium] appelbergii TaxID=2939269 RepID=UPI00293937F4|nr:MBL fold metallo-hydrolase [Mycobacterium sp. 21AC1]MDV3126468.1 MBL fold metallo-hydrolase [Mycobacterium sp. 21AC1]